MGVMKQRVRAAAPVRKDRTEKRLRADVPGVVKAHLGARHGDQLIFEEGCDAAVQRAALGDKYFVVRLERASEESAEERARREVW